MPHDPSASVGTTLPRRRLIASAAALSAALSPLRSFASAKRNSAYFDAFYFGFPIYEFARTAQRQGQALTARGAAPNGAFSHRRGLSDHTSRNVTTPNNDTVYSSARLDLSNGPALLEIPTLRDRYFSVAFMNAFTDNFFFVGTRATGGEGGRYLVVGPSWRGDANGVKLIRSVSNDVWALARIGVAGESDLHAATAAQDGLKVLEFADHRPFGVSATTPSDSENFLALVAEMFSRIDMEALLKRGVRRHQRVGLTSDLRLTSNDRAVWKEIIPLALEAVARGYGGDEIVANGWRYSGRHAGTAAATDQLRAQTALSGLAALPSVEALYASCFVDGAGDALDGSRRYVLSLPATVPTDGFWSLSLYAVEPDGRLFFIENAMRRYRIGDRTEGLIRRQDGGVDVAIGPEYAQTQSAALNWLPSRQGPIRLVFRNYLPQKSTLDGRWRLPRLLRLSAR